MKNSMIIMKKIKLALIALGIISSVGVCAEESIQSWHSFPENATSPQTSKLLIERRLPKTVTPDQDYDYFIKVSNQSLYKIDHVIVVEEIPDNFKYVRATPSPSVRGNTLTWKIGMMAPRQKETFKITGKAIKSGSINHDGKAIVTYDLGSMTAVMDVIQANLSADISNPENVVVSKDIPVKITVKNLGTADVENAVLTHDLAKGLSTEYGGNKISENIGNIAPNGTKVLNLNLKANAAGSYSESLTIKGKNNVSATVVMKVNVGMPKLAVKSSSPEKRFVGNNIPLKIEIKNQGDGIASNTVTKLDLPSTVKFVRANEGGDLQGNQIVWDLGVLVPGETKSLSAIIVGKEITTLTTKAVTTADAAKSVTSNFRTVIGGIPALMISLSDVNDPVPVGSTETYNVRISNQGSLAARNVVVKCKLEDSMKLVGINGPTAKESESGNVVTLKPLASLSPGASATWNVTVKAIKAGDARFEVSTESRELTRPVYENESTHFYND